MRPENEERSFDSYLQECLENPEEYDNFKILSEEEATEKFKNSPETRKVGSYYVKKIVN